MQFRTRNACFPIVTKLSSLIICSGDDRSVEINECHVANWFRNRRKMKKVIDQTGGSKCKSPDNSDSRGPNTSNPNRASRGVSHMSRQNSWGKALTIEAGNIVCTKEIWSLDYLAYFSWCFSVTIWIINWRQCEVINGFIFETARTVLR